MKFKRNLYFKKSKIWKNEDTYSVIKDVTLLLGANEIAQYYDIKIVSFSVDDYTDEGVISVWCDRDIFIAFLIAFCKKFEKRLESIKY